MVRMGAVWDSTTQVFAGRGATIARVAMLTLFLPSVIRAASALALGDGGLGETIDTVIGLIVFVVTLIGTLAITALASDPAIDERGSYGVARQRLPGGIAAVLLVGLGILILAVPGFVLLAKAGFDFQAAAAGRPQPPLDPGVALWGALYLTAWSVVLIWAMVRLTTLYAVIVNERRGVGAIGRAFALTKGLAFRLFGVIILYGVVLAVLWSAATSVFGLIFRLLLGSEQAGLVQFLTAVVAAVVLTGATALQAVFCARLYAAVVAERGTPTSL
jgi:hypothetical protein